MNISEETTTKDTPVKQKHKGGRPVKKITRKHSLRIRLTDIELFLIHEKAKVAGMKPSSWFRSAAKSAKVQARLKPEDLKILRMLAGMANNLNQLAHLAHVSGLLVIHRKCRELLEDIQGMMKKISHDDR